MSKDTSKYRQAGTIEGNLAGPLGMLLLLERYQGNSIQLPAHGGVDDTYMVLSRSTGKRSLQNWASRRKTTLWPDCIPLYGRRLSIQRRAEVILPHWRKSK